MDCRENTINLCCRTSQLLEEGQGRRGGGAGWGAAERLLLLLLADGSCPLQLQSCTVGCWAAPMDFLVCSHWVLGEFVSPALKRLKIKLQVSSNKKQQFYYKNMIKIFSDVFLCNSKYFVFHLTGTVSTYGYWNWHSQTSFIWWSTGCCAATNRCWLEWQGPHM